MNDKTSTYILAIALFLMTATSMAQRDEISFRLMQYNVENLFDTCHDAGYDDYEFQPEGDRKWGSQRYWAKQARLSRVIAAAGGASPIDLVALCEVENDSVVFDLCKKTKLHWLGYEYLMTKSNDVRGLDVALLYQPGSFRPLCSEAIRMTYDKNKERPTRDILHVSGLLVSGDTLDVFVNHWPSRRGSFPLTERYRKRAAEELRNYADSIMSVRETPLVVFMGDFNDEEENSSISKVLGAKVYKKGTIPIKANEMYLLHKTHKRGETEARGTYKFRGEWNRLDHIMVSGNTLSDDSPLRYVYGSYRIFSPSFLIESNSAADRDCSIKRTFLGPIYKGGTSDHLPVIIDLNIRLDD